MAVNGGSAFPRSAQETRMSEDMEARFLAKVAGVDGNGCWLWAGATNSDGYGTFKVKGKAVLAHRYACEREHGPLGASNALHACNNPACVRVHAEHVYRGSQRQNMRDMRAAGTHPNQRLTWDDVDDIRRRNDSNAAAARRHGISREHARQIRLGRRWGVG